MTMHMKALPPGAIELKGDEDDGSELVTKALADLQKTVDDKLKALEAKAGDAIKITTRLDEIEKKLARPAIIGKAATGDDEAATLEKKAFAGFLRHGREALTVEEVKALNISTDTAGGYLATPDFQAEVLKKIVEINPIRSIARVGSTGASSVILPTQTGTPTGMWVGETEDRSGTEGTYGQLEIEIHEASCYVDVSNKLLEDAAVNVEAEVSSDLAREFARLESSAFVVGTGVKMPFGFMQDANIGSVNSGSAAAVSADGLISLFYSMPAEYRNKGTWILNGTTLGSIRKLKTTDNQYLWQPGLVAGQPETILGRPVAEAPLMPNEAANAFPVAFGDFSVGYRIYDRIALALLRDPYSVATKGLVRFHARRRVGGAVVMAEALRKLKCAT